MKRFIVFIGSFTIVYFVLQWVSGFILTALHSTDASEPVLPKVVHFGESSSPLFIILSASIAYLLSRIVQK